jgi:hypothetical protein
MKKTLQTLSLIAFVLVMTITACTDELTPDATTIDVEEAIITEDIIDQRSTDGEEDDSIRWEGL